MCHLCKAGEMKKARVYLLIILIFLVACSEAEYSPTIRFPYQWLDEPGYGGTIDQQEFPEPSGICFHSLRKTLFVVSDEGELTKIETDGTPVFRVKIPGDLEGVTVNPETGLLYLVKEGVAHEVVVNYREWAAMSTHFAIFSAIFVKKGVEKCVICLIKD